MEEMMLATIAQVMSQHTTKQGMKKVEPEHVVKLPDNGIKGFRGIPHWDVYAARVEEYICIAYVYPDGKVNVYIHC